MTFFLTWLAVAIFFMCVVTGYFAYLDAKGKGSSWTGGQGVAMYIGCLFWYITVPIFVSYVLVATFSKPKQS